MIDIHSHILPGVDDGARTFDDSIAIADWLVRQGVTDLIATPHYIDETIYVSPRATNLELMDELQRRLGASGIHLNLYLGNEIYICENIAELVEAGKMSPLAGSDYLLVELPLNGDFPNYEDHLCALMGIGYKVILAHPERYATVQEDYQKVLDLYEDGILLQCNLRSILGTYGKEAERTVKRLAKDRLIFTFGSDTHRPGRMDYLTLALKKLGKYYNERELNQVLEANPRMILS